MRTFEPAARKYFRSTIKTKKVIFVLYCPRLIVPLSLRLESSQRVWLRILSFGNAQINLAFRSLIRTFAHVNTDTLFNI